MATSLVFPVLRQVQGVIEVADKCREDLKDISKYIHTLSAVLVRILGGFEPGAAWEQSFLDLLEDIFRTVFAALRLADRCILYDGFGFFAKAAAFGLEREVSRVKEQLRVDLESLNAFLLADIWVATRAAASANASASSSAAAGSAAAARAPAACPPAIAHRQASQAHRLLLSMPKLQTSRHPSKQVAQALAWLRVGKAKAQAKAMAALFKMLSTGAHWPARAAEVLSAGGTHAVVHHLGSPDPALRDAAARTLARLAQAEAAACPAPGQCPSEVLAGVISTLDAFTYAQASGFVVVERAAQAPGDELFLAAVAAAATLQLFAITPAHCAAAVHNGALPAVVDALAAAAATQGSSACCEEEEDDEAAAAGLGGLGGRGQQRPQQEARGAPGAPSSSSSGTAAAAGGSDDDGHGCDAQQPGDQQAEAGSGGSAALLHSSLVVQLTRTVHLLMLHDEGSKQQLHALGLLPLLASILCTTQQQQHPADAAAAAASSPGSSPRDSGSGGEGGQQQLDAAHPQLEAARALVCLASLPAARADLEARPEALQGLRRLADAYQGCFAGQEVAQWLGVGPHADAPPICGLAGGASGLCGDAGSCGVAPPGAGGQEQPQQQQWQRRHEEDEGDSEQQLGMSVAASGGSWLAAPGRAVASATAAASSLMLSAWRGPPRGGGGGQQLSFPIDAHDEWGSGSGDVDHILLDMKPSDMQ